MRLEEKLGRARMSAGWRRGWGHYRGQGFRYREGRISPSKVKFGRGIGWLFWARRPGELVCRSAWLEMWMKIKRWIRMKRQQKPSGLGCGPPQGPSHSTPLAGSHVLLNSPLHSHIPSVWPSFSSSWALASLPTNPPASSLPPPTHSSHNC